MAATRAALAAWVCILWVTGINCKHDHPVSTYFGRVHPNGTIVDARNPANKLKFSFSSKPTSLDPDASLKVSPSSQITNGAEVKVMWSGVTSPSSKDVVILYCPPDAKPDHYLDYINVSSIETYSKGYGEFEVRLWNMRKECQFRYYRIGNYSMLAAESNVVTFEGGAEIPLQGHLALTGDPTEMRVMWVSGTSKLSFLYALCGEGEGRGGGETETVLYILLSLGGGGGMVLKNLKFFRTNAVMA